MCYDKGASAKLRVIAVQWMEKWAMLDKNGASRKKNSTPVIWTYKIYIKNLESFWRWRYWTLGLSHQLTRRGELNNRRTSHRPTFSPNNYLTAPRNRKWDCWLSTWRYREKLYRSQKLAIPVFEIVLASISLKQRQNQGFVDTYQNLHQPNCIEVHSLEIVVNNGGNLSYLLA